MGLQCNKQNTLLLPVSSTPNTKIKSEPSQGALGTYLIAIAIAAAVVVGRTGHMDVGGVRHAGRRRDGAAARAGRRGDGAGAGGRRGDDATHAAAGRGRDGPAAGEGGRWAGAAAH